MINAKKQQIDYLKIICFFKSFMFLALIFLGFKNKFVENPWLIVVFVSLLLILCLTQIFSIFSISNTYIGRRKTVAKF